MFCPKCRYEYKPEISTCPDCDERLVVTLPEETSEKAVSPESYEDWIHMARLTSTMSAEMLENVLRSKNIPVVILSESGHFGQTGQMGASSFRPIGGGYSVMVPAEHVAAVDAEGIAILGDEWIKAKLTDN